jgi:hypothetical protein
MEDANLTRSAKVTGRLGDAANLLISSSAIWAEEGGWDQVGIDGGNAASDVYRRSFCDLSFTIGLLIILVIVCAIEALGC